MIQVNATDYIVALWMVERVSLGKVFIYAVKGEEENEWTGYIKYIYVNDDFNIYMCDNDYKNTFTHKNISELDIIKICNDRTNEMAMLFCHNREKIIIGGDIDKYNRLALKNPWFPPIMIMPEVAQRKEKRLKEMRKV